MNIRFFIIPAIIFIFTAAHGQVDQKVWMPAFQAHVNAKENAIDYAEYFVTHSHQSRNSKAFHVYMQQKLNDLHVIDGQMSLHFSKTGELLAIQDKFVQQISSKTEVPAIIKPVADIIGNVWTETGFFDLPQWQVESVSDEKHRTTIIQTNGYFYKEVTAVLRYVLNENNKLVLCWEINFETRNGRENWLVYAKVENGEIIRKHNQVLHCAFTQEESQRQKPFFVPSGLDMPPAQYHYRVFPLKTESPTHGPRTLEINPANLTASPYNWHDTNGVPGEEHTTTKGNNVEAREDRDGDNGTLGQMANGGPDLIFDFPWNPYAHPHTNQNASITNLFYWNNIIHDIVYQYGFDEPSGNFQTNNYGNGGLGNDHILADAMDGEGFNNANFFAPTEGTSPRMQMFLWNGPVYLTINEPTNIQGDYAFAKASFGPNTFYVFGDIEMVNDGSSNPTRGCNPLVNGSQILGKIAMVDNGSCEFSLKCRNAQLAGAIAVIVCNDVPGPPYVMPPGSFGPGITIPSVMMSQQDCNTIKLYIAQGVNISLVVGDPVDSDYDNGIICHEYGHGISIRLTGGAVAVNCLLNQEQMGEGWSDWYGLMLTMEEDDVESRARGIGSYVFNQPIDGPGIRTFKYSTDMNVNPHTYNSIISEVIPHGVGSVWCAMLWELTWALIREYGYDPDLYNGTGGNNIALNLVTEALKFQPCSPGFVDGRDAILLADQVLYDGEHACLIWKSFAKRGLGYSANQGSSQDRSDGAQAFDMPRSCCKFVSNTLDSGNGSLRDALDCAVHGDTITFLNFIKDDTIKLTSASLSVFRNITIKKPADWNLTIESTGDFPVFETYSTVLMENLKLKAGPAVNVRGLRNTGNLMLKNVDLFDPLSNSGSGRTILNQGNIQVQGGVLIRD